MSDKKMIVGRVTIPIEGMSCSSCAQRIENTLSKLNGVESVTVNFATQKATVSGSITYSEIFKAIEGLGYKAIQKSMSLEKDLQIVVVPSSVEIKILSIHFDFMIPWLQFNDFVKSVTRPITAFWSYRAVSIGCSLQSSYFSLLWIAMTIATKASTLSHTNPLTRIEQFRRVSTLACPYGLRSWTIPSTP